MTSSAGSISRPARTTVARGEVDGSGCCASTRESRTNSDNAHETFFMRGF